MRAKIRFTASVLAAGAFLFSGAAHAGPVEDRAAQLSALIGKDSDDTLSKDKQAQLLAQLGALTPLQRFRVTTALDHAQASDMRTIYDRLGDQNRAAFLALLKESGDAASAAGLQTTGVISDVDDTAIPTEYRPDGSKSFVGARHFYDTLTHEPIHYVSARPKAFVPETRAHLKDSGMPDGTFDTRTNVLGILFGGNDDIEKSKVANIELWLALHPGQRFVLLGDTIQRDPEVYRTIRTRHPESVAAVFVHEAGGTDRAQKDFPGVTFFNTYPEAEAVWTAHAGDPKPLPELTTQTTHPVKKSSGGFFHSIGGFFKDVALVAKKGIVSGFEKIGGD